MASFWRQLLEISKEQYKLTEGQGGHPLLDPNNITEYHFIPTDQEN